MMHIGKKKIVIILALAALALGAVIFWIYREAVFSKDILRLEIIGPATAKMGEEIEYTVIYKNNGNFVLESPRLVFQLPDHSLTEDSQLRISKEVREIQPGQEEMLKFKARLLGKEGDVKTVRVWLSYVPHNLSVRYESDTAMSTKIESVPMTLTYDIPSKVEKGKEFAYVINYFSNVDYPLEDASIRLGAVSGFDVKSSDPESIDDTEWKLQTLEKGEGGRITIRGTIGAETGSAMDFSAKLGVWRSGTFVVIKEATQQIQVIQPLLFVSQQVNGSSDYIASPGETLQYELFLRNVAPTASDNLFVMSRIEGSAFDLSSLVSSEGQTRPNDNLIVWDSRQIPRLRHVGANQEVRLTFSVRLKDSWAISESQRNRTAIKNKVTVSDISQEFANKVNSRLELSQQAALSGASYQITWQVKNHFNDMKNVKVRAVLPLGVTLDDIILPEEQAANFSFDSKSREVVWLAGSVPAGSGIGQAAPALSFQISSAGGFASGMLVGQATVSGEDQFTGASIQSTASAIFN